MPRPNLDNIKDEELVELDEEDIYRSPDLHLEQPPQNDPYVLAQLVGTFMVIDEDNGNGRSYEYETINKGIVDNPYVKQMILNKCLLGEAHHPLDRTSIWFDEACISVRELWIDSTGKKLMGRADILATPKGKILYILCKYGTKPGISARANGKGLKRGKHLVIKPQNYLFKTFDVVMNPGFTEARPSVMDSSGQQPLQTFNEELDIDGIYNDFKGMIENKTCDAQNLKSYIEYSGSDKLKELLPLFEEDTSDTDTSASESKIQALTEENNSLKAYQFNAKKELSECMEKINSLNEEIQSVNDDYSELSMATVSEDNQKSDEAAEFVDSLLEELSDMKTKFKDVSEQLSEANGKIQSLNEENVENYSKLCDALSIIDSMSEDFTSKQSKIEELSEEVTKSNDTISSLNEEIESSRVAGKKSPKIQKKIDLFNDSNATLNEENESRIPARQVNVNRVNMIKAVGGR